ncbi:MAG: hypothetical protein HON51_02845 [Gammaproteobacteria bacterium]|jgi:hypothetical protein|nr:hypothetical protein [Gammaproteobacteria bacterium]MBT5826498.1 hypothetical protein [Gammaproteobacteria bacterium]MBT6419339.1 hypothetical protein [Gammaproteobacteria bacterium]MBT6575171.1 hypothetical protein [Gammaproteobacteria bacterium]MBT7436623.1 hypothetical protein [Gammaproteobacteria bacterium]
MIKRIIIGLIIIGFIGCAQNNTMELEGRLAVKGSSIHTYLNIKDIKSNKNYKIQNQESFDLMQKQNQTLRVKVRLIKKAIGPGFPAVVEVLGVIEVK